MKKSPRRQCVTEAHLGLLTNPHRLRPQNLSLQTSTKNIVALNFAFTWKKQEIYAAISELQGIDIFISKDIGAYLDTRPENLCEWQQWQQDWNNLWSWPGDPNKPSTFTTPSPHDPILHSNVHTSMKT